MGRSTLVEKADLFAHSVYQVTREFPKEEMFGITSQLRRAAVSVVLNIVEGFARQKDKEFDRFLSIAYGSYKEAKYLLHFACKEGYLNKAQYQHLFILGEEVGKMLWGAMRRVKARIEQ